MSHDKKSVTTPDGDVFTLIFTQGLPLALSGPHLFITQDGAIHAGELLVNEFGKQVLRTTNPAGGIHNVFDIQAAKISGYAPCGATRMINDLPVIAGRS